VALIVYLDICTRVTKRFIMGNPRAFCW